MRTTLWILAVAIAAGAAGVYFYPAATAATPVVDPTPAEINHVHALGRLEPRGRLLRITAASGNEGACIEKLLVDEGNDVVAGQVLAILDNHARREAALLEARAHVKTAAAKLADVRAGAKESDIGAQRSMVQLLDAHRNHCRRQLDRARQLYESKATSDEELENRQWAYDKASLEHAQAEQQLLSIQEVRETEIQVAEQELAFAEAAVQTAVSNLQVTEIRAPIAGRILQLHCRTGERLGENGFAQIGDVNNMQAVAEVYEADLPKLSLGCAAEVLVESTGERLPGVVVELGNMVARKVVLTNDPVSDTDARVVEVRVQLTPEASARVERLSNARVQVHLTIDADK